MNTSVRREDTLAGFWFLTLVVALLGPLLFAVVLALDKHSGDGGVFNELVISPDSARTILGSVAGSLITIASLTVSLTIVTLQLLSNQYTPRAVRGFLRKRVSQVVSGGFIGVFVYCVLLLVAVREPGDYNDPFVPSLGVVVAIVLALVDLVLLVVFINSLAKTIQVSTMTSELATDTIRAIDAMHVREDSAPTSSAPPVGDAVELIHADATGYVRRTSVPDVGGSAAWRVEVLARPGDFVTRYETVIRWVGTGALSSDDRRRLGRAVLVGSERDLAQDPAFGVRQLVDIALRALSAGINDPTTAVTCVGYLRWIFEHLADVDLPETRVAALVGKGSVVQHGFTFEDYLLLLGEVASYAPADLRVVLVLLEALVQVQDRCLTAGREDRAESVRVLGHRLLGRAEQQLADQLPVEVIAPLRAHFGD